MDAWTLFAALSLTLFGLLMVYSASAWIGQTRVGDWEFFLQRQSAFAAVGVMAMLTLSRLDYRVFRRLSPHLMLGSLALLVFVLMAGQEVNGARRWVHVMGLSLQPSELVKLTLAVFLATTLARRGERIRVFRTGFLPVMLMATVTMVLVLLERDLGTTILLGLLTLTLLFAAGTRLSFVAAAIMAAFPILWHQVLDVSYRRGRIEAFLSGDGYQVKQALISVGSGGLWGVGLGQGRQKLGFLPEAHTDFILAIVGEELGFIGIVGVLVVFGVLVVRGLVIARAATDRFGMFLATAISALFGLQTIINMAVVLELIPAKGITLPFLSYGGSSLVTSLACVGILLSISRRPPISRFADMRRKPARISWFGKKIAGAKNRASAPTA